MLQLKDLITQLKRLNSIARLSGEISSEYDDWYKILGISEFVLVDDETGDVYDSEFIEALLGTHD